MSRARSPHPFTPPPHPALLFLLPPNPNPAQAHALPAVPLRPGLRPLSPRLRAFL